MDKDILKGLKISLGIILGLSFFFGLVFAVGFHSANEILPGIFEGNYIFNGNLTVNGTTIKQNSPLVLAYKSGNGNVLTASSGEEIFDSVDVDLGNNFNTTNGRFTAPVDGRYLVSYNFLNDQSNNGYTNIFLRINGVSNSLVNIYNSHPMSGSETRILNLTQGDYVDFSGSNFFYNQIYRTPSFSIFLIG